MIRLNSVTKRFGQKVVLNNLNLDVNAHEILSLLGPNGCGKTTTLNLIAGLSRLDEGTIYIDDKLVEGKIGKKIVHLKPSERKIGYVFQNIALFPHMRIRDNIAYGLKASHMSKPDIKAKTKTLLDFVGLQEYAASYPHQLSGGQRQRAALARSLAMDPEVLLLDEPVSAVDPYMKESIRLEFKKYLRELKITALYVTHNLNEAFMMSDRIAVMGNGQIEQIGDRTEIFSKPTSRFVAEFFGLNVLSGKAHVKEAGLLEVDVGGVQILSACQSVMEGGVVVTLRPDDVTLSLSPKVDPQWETVPYNSLKGTVIDVIQMRSSAQALIDVGFQVRCRVQESIFRQLGLEHGKEVFVQFRADALNITSCN
jgi:ABC-type Fe3+/spermidine/putrescine transport system ATPase subunit